MFMVRLCEAGQAENALTLQGFTFKLSEHPAAFTLLSITIKLRERGGVQFPNLTSTKPQIRHSPNVDDAIFGRAGRKSGLLCNQTLHNGETIFAWHSSETQIFNLESSKTTSRKMDNQNATNIQNCGIYTGVGGNVRAKKIKITINPSPETSTATTKPSFRFNIPTPTRHFKGRKKTLEAISDHFTNLPAHNVNCWARIVAIVGLGGMGKTETAYKFAAEYKTTFPNVAWINAETESSALTSFLGLAKHLKIVSNDRKEADLDLVREIYHHIDQEDYDNVLFIFDNAIRLNWDDEEFGIIEYLPTDDLRNQRFPNILITTQTQDWERSDINIIQVDELSEEESFEFLRSIFQIESSICDDLFKELHQLLEGYPLVMNLAASQIDYNPKKDSVHQLQQQIRSYICKLEQEQRKILNDKIHRAWPTKYNKTLSNVWKLTFERIQSEENGHDALELLQFMSFLQVPISSVDAVELLDLDFSSDCSHPPIKTLEVRVKELFRLLERFYTVRILEVSGDDEEGFCCTLGIHRLVQLVVRQQMDANKGLERFLFYFGRRYKSNGIGAALKVNESALEEVLHRSQLSQRALPYVGVLACHGLLAASKIVEARQHETKAAATFWRLCNLERGMRTLSENAIQVLREFIGLSRSEERLQDRCFFGDITINLLTKKGYLKYKKRDGAQVPGYLDVDGLDVSTQDVGELVAEFILNVHSIQDFHCNSDWCWMDRLKRDHGLSVLTTMLSKPFIRGDPINSTLTADVIADTWLALSARMKYYDTDGGWPAFIFMFWKDMYKIFYLQDESQKLRFAALRCCLWHRGLAVEIIQMFDFISRRLTHHRTSYNLIPFLFQLMEVWMDGMDLKDERVQKVISAFCQMTTTIETKFLSKDYRNVPRQWFDFTVDVFSVWIKLFLMDDDPPSHQLFDSLSHLKFLDWMERSPKLNIVGKPFFRLLRAIPNKYRSEYFPQFIQRFSSSDIKPIQTLVNICQRLMEDDKDR